MITSTTLARGPDITVGKLRIDSPNPGVILALTIYADLVMHVGQFILRGLLPPIAFWSILCISIGALGLNNRRSLADGFQAFAPWALFLLSLILSLFWTSNLEYGHYKLNLLLLRGFLPGFLFVCLLRSRTLDLTPVLAVGLLYCTLVLIAGEPHPDYPGRNSLWGSNPIWVGRASIALGIVAATSSGNFWLRSICMLASLAAALSTQSRAPLAIGALLIAWSTFSMAIASKSFKRTFLSGLVLLAGIGASAWAIHAEVISIDRILRLWEEGSADQNTLGRIWLQQNALSMFTGHPFLGAGLGGYAPAGTRVYPHSIAFEVIAELGLVGAATFFLGLFYCFAKCRSPHIRFLLLTFFFFALTSGDIGSNTDLFFLATVAPAFNRAEQWGNR